MGTSRGELFELVGLRGGICIRLRMVVCLGHQLMGLRFCLHLSLGMHHCLGLQRPIPLRTGIDTLVRIRPKGPS